MFFVVGAQGRETLSTGGAMEESQDILMKTLEKSGVSIPANVSSIGELSSEALVSICAQTLNLIDRSASFCTELPDSMPDRFRICTDIALSVKNLGYIGDMSYYKFLYPSEEDTYKLVRFLVERLSETNEETKASGVNDEAGKPKRGENSCQNSPDDRRMKEDNETFDTHLQKVEAVLKDLRLASEISQLSESKERDTLAKEPFDADLFSSGMDYPGTSQPCLGKTSGNEEIPSHSYGECYPESAGNSTPEDSSSKIRCKTDKLWNQENVVMEELTCGTEELHNLNNELELLKAAAERLFDDKHPVEFYIEQLNEQLAAKRHNITDLEGEWNSVRQHLEAKKQSLIDRLYADKPEAQDKLQKLGDIGLEIQSVSSEIQKREEERSNLCMEIERQPKMAPRKSYIQRVKEITKNSRKLDADIQRILRETRELQLESNSIQERLHRTYTVLDEMVLREAKKDQAGRQVCKLLTNIHAIFEQISEKILMTDRVRREVAEYEKKLATIASRNLSSEQLQADLDSIRRQNEDLEKEVNQA